MMGRQTSDQSRLFYAFNLEERIPAHHLLRRLNPIVTRALSAGCAPAARLPPNDDTHCRTAQAP
jgi:hypothetical protein